MQLQEGSSSNRLPGAATDGSSKPMGFLPSSDTPILYCEMILNVAETNYMQCTKSSNDLGVARNIIKVMFLRKSTKIHFGTFYIVYLLICS
jgi:hypothetical protein